MTTTARFTPIITTDEDAELLDAATLYAQIGRWPLMRVGAVDRMYAERYVQFDVTMGRAKRRVIITLTPADTYSIEVGQVARKTYEWRSLSIRRDVHAAEIGETIEALYQEVFA